jgi:ATP-dependent DNA helicase RecQ
MGSFRRMDSGFGSLVETSSLRDRASMNSGDLAILPAQDLGALAGSLACLYNRDVIPTARDERPPSMSLTESPAGADLEETLRDRFGLEQFRPGQREVIENVLQGRDVLCVMPTGGGKSLCYQLPGIASDALTVVVSPLIALIADQYRRLVQAGHPAVMLASGMGEEAVQIARRRINDGSARIVFCSPERFGAPSFTDALERRGVDLFVVDEAHCVSEWGHDFRPDYLRLHRVIERLGHPTVMAATATATEAVAEEIVRRLELRDPVKIRSGFDRPNLSFDVLSLEGDGSKERRYGLLRHGLGEDVNRPAIVYAGTRNDVEEITGRLNEDHIDAVAYHAGLGAEQRAVAQHRFMTGDVDVVVATNAFGMGVDKADVRSVWHATIPTSVEASTRRPVVAGVTAPRPGRSCSRANRT